MSYQFLCTVPSHQLSHELVFIVRLVLIIGTCFVLLTMFFVSIVPPSMMLSVHVCRLAALLKYN